MHKALFSLFSMFLLMALSSCGGHDLSYTGATYPASNQVTKVFQTTEVPKSCRVFAEVLAILPANQSGKEIEQAVFAEAGQRGADMVLIGQSRQYDDDDGPQFLYFGPKREYPFTDQWRGWRFGYALWEKQGDWLNIGYAELGNSAAHYETPVIMQLAMLKCR